MTSLNACIDPTTILQDIGVRVNHTPDITTCPLCRGREFMVNADPAGGGWYCCNTCHFAGDSIELVAQVNSFGALQAIEKLRRADSTGSFTQRNIDDHMHWAGRRKAVNTFWESCSDRDFILKNASEGGRAMLESFKISKQLQTSDWHNKLGQFVGLTTTAFYRSTVEPEDKGNKLPGAAGKNYLISPLFDAPGRIAAISAFDIYAGNKRSDVIRLPGGSTDALMFMNGLHLFEEVLYATSDLQWALALQTWAYLSAMGPVPVVGYTLDTKQAWMNLRPKRVIFWNTETTPDVFLAARQVPERAYIAKGPRISDTEDPFAKLAGSSARSMLNTMQTEAEPWLKALKDYLTSVSYSQVQDVINRLDLAPAHRQEMLSYCQTKEEREKIATLVDTGVIQMSIPMATKGRFLVQKADGWYAQYKNEAELHLISEAMPIIETFTNFKSKVLYTGHIRVRNKSIPFEVDRDDFSIEWLKRFCQEHDEIIEVHDSIGKNFSHYVLQFHNPDKLEGLDRIGWDSRDQSFVFPSYTLVNNGTFRELRRPTACNHPTQQLHAPSPFVLSHVRNWLDNTPARATYWALMTNVLANVIAPAIGERTRGIGLVDDSHVASELLDQVAADTYSAVTKVATTGKESEILAAVLQAEQQHLMPACIDLGSSPVAFRWINAEGDRNAFLLFRKNMMKAALLRGGWTMIQPESLASASTVLNSSASIMPAILAYFQKTGRKLPKAERHYVFSVIRLIQAWLEQEFQIECPDVLKAAAKIIDVGPGDDSAGLVNRFVGMVTCLTDEGVLTVDTTNDLVVQSNTRAAITIAGDIVFVNHAVIQRALQNHRLYTPGETQLTNAFQETGMLVEDVVGLHAFLGWRLHREKWVEVAQAWNR